MSSHPEPVENNAMALLVEAMVYISTNNSREIYMTVLDPYGKMNNDPSWTPGRNRTLSCQRRIRRRYRCWVQTATSWFVNDTRVTIDDAYSFHPSIGVDMQGNTHIAWMDGRNYGFEKACELRSVLHQTPTSRCRCVGRC